ncbi:MAG: UDP-N-acetylglucosamine--N-acetylmuramyl-(pentapeptide) pyrophosphoryl-undecaprenol N-acetylglucosamine transferase [Planctomycetes bacterium ADurb.Bin401]|nr:MAG: UDP-N-acetylglucosamine--N-acetylmuramyl-(pentapeptide) pyrophosphoryl-undecaprenol N-acetylglucosamine transferase [Planctomycetes bacterium ADurb.Bin401]
MLHVYFAGGGTGGHIYPALAVAQQLLDTLPDCRITFFCSQRPIDARVLGVTGYRFIPLPVGGFSGNPIKFAKFLKSVFAAKKIVRKTILYDNNEKSVMFSVGGFVSTGAVLAAKSLNIPVAMLNIDSIPGKANSFLARYARDIFVQFPKTKNYFGLNNKRVIVTGCPLRKEFFKPDVSGTVESLGLSPKKKILLVTGASGGALNINNVIGYLLDRFDIFEASWQIVHLAGIAHYDAVRALYRQCELTHKILDYCDDMPGLLSAADLVIGRAGAMSIAEFAASCTPAICLPYPYHKDMHQRVNAKFLVDAGCAAIVDDLCDTEKTAAKLWPVLCDIMSNDEKRETMRLKCAAIANPEAASAIVNKILGY